MAKPLTVDFTGVEAGGGGRTRIPEGDYRVKVTKVTFGRSKSSDNPMLTWDFEVSEGKFKGKKLRDRTVLTTESLWKLKQLLEAMGLSVPSKKVALQLEKYQGRELGVTATDDEYEGKISSKVSDYVSLDVLEGLDVDENEADEGDEEPQPKAKKGKKGKKAKAPVSDEEEDIEELDLDDM